MMVLVVTGGIGSGKSEVCRIMRDMGYRCQYNADARAKALYEEHPTLLADIEKSLGCILRDEEGHFQPSKLAAVIFTDRNALEQVEAHLFPAMIDDFTDFLHCFRYRKTFCLSRKEGFIPDCGSLCHFDFLRNHSLLLSVSTAVSGYNEQNLCFQILYRWQGKKSIRQPWEVTD